MVFPGFPFNPLGNLLENRLEDGLHRVQKLASLQRASHDLGTSPAPSAIAPPANYKKTSFKGYSFFIRPFN